MENNQENTQAEVVELEIIEKLPKNSLEELLSLYASSASMETYVKIPFALVAILFLIHNVFLAGKSFAIDTYNTIQNAEISIVAIIVLSIFVMAIMAMSKNSKLKTGLKEASKRYNIKIETVQNEFNALALSLYGGRGVVLKK